VKLPVLKRSSGDPAVCRQVLRIHFLPLLSLHEVDGAIPNDRFPEDDELGDRAAPKLRGAAGVKGSQRFGDDVFRVGGGQPERSERAAPKWYPPSSLAETPILTFTAISRNIILGFPCLCAPI